MRQLITLIATACLISATGWYVIYKTNPSRICDPHPDPARKKAYWYCKPGFDMPRDSFVDGYNPVDRRERPIQYKEREILRRQQFEE